MKKIILISSVSVLVIGGLVYFVVSSPKNNVGNGGSPECSEICSRASSLCPSLNLSLNNCATACGNWDNDVKEKAKQASNCEDLTKIPELISTLIPEMNTPEPIISSNDCEAACGSYVGKCLTLVPNASEALFEEGLNSCKQECTGWNLEKVDCMINAFDCEAMTNICGL